ncbi:MAG: autotransporter-associated beta strand repeat-containing protein [Akkermansiaceae bacterium]
MKSKNLLFATSTAAMLFVAASNMACAATFTFNGTTTGTAPGSTWSSVTGWDALPVSATDTSLVFGGASLTGGTNVHTSQDIASPFQLNSLTMSYVGAATASSVFINTNALSFVSNGLTTPTINLDATGTSRPQITFASAVTFANNTTISGASDALFTAGIANTGGAVVTKGGSGTVRIQLNNAAYTGNFTVSGGLLQVGNNGSTGDAGSGTVTLSGGGAFTVRKSGSLTLNNTIEGTGNVAFQLRSNSVVTVNRANTYTGTTTLAPTASAQLGTLRLGVNNGLSNTSVLTITNSGESVQTFDLAGLNQTLGGLSAGSGTASATNTKVTLGSGTLTVNDADSRIFAGEISGAGNVVKQGAGAWTLRSANTYSGTTTISGGSLVLGVAGSINDTSRISITAGGTFDVSLIPSYTLSASTSLSASGTASPADIKGDTTVDLGSQPITLTHDGTNPPLTVSQGELTLTGNPLIVNSASPLPTGSYTLIQQASGSITQSGSITVAGTALSGSTAALDFSDSSAVKLALTEAPVSDTNSTLTASPATLVADNITTSTVTLTLKDASNVALPNVGVKWSLSGTGNTVSAAEYGSTNGSGVCTFMVKSVKAETKTVTVTVGSHIFTTNIDFTAPLAGNTLTWDPALTTIASNGAGPWDLTTANWANSGTNVAWPNNGNDTAFFGTAGPLAANATVTLGAPIVAANLTFTNTSANTNQYTITGAGLNTLTLAGTVDVSANARLFTEIAGTGFTKAGTGTLRVDGNSPSYSGNVALNTGTLQIGNNGTDGDLGTGTITLAGDALFVVRKNGALTLNNTIAGSTTGTVGFQLNGGNVVTVAKANTYAAAGGTYLQSTGANALGTLELGIAGGLPATTAFRINTNGTSVQTFDLAGFNQTLGSLATGAGGSTSSSIITSSTGTPVLTVNGSATTTFAGLVSGSLSLSKGGSGTLTLTGSCTYSGDTTVSEGTLTLPDENTANEASSVNIATDAFLDLNFGGTDTVDKLFIGGVQQPAGVYRALDNPGADFQISQITGSGTLTVTSNPGSNPYSTWATDKGLTGANNGKDQDPDNDGRSNLGEFAFNGDPLSGSDNGKVFGLTADSDADGDSTKELVLTVAVRTGTAVFAGTPSPSANHAADGITYTIEGSVNLGSFLTAVDVVPTAVTTGGLPPAGSGYEYRSFSLNGSNGLPGKGFLRAKVTSP